MGTISKQEWNEIEEKLKSLYSRIELDCDGFKVSISLKQISQFKNAIVIYVNGYFKGEWFNGKSDHEEAKRFFPLRSKAVCSAKRKKQLIKVFGKRAARQRFDIDRRQEFREIFWTNFNSLKRHFIANNESITWIKDDA